MTRLGPAYLALVLVISARASSPTDTKTRHLHLFGWQLELQENEAIQSPHYTECRYYKGRILYEDVSTAMVTECDGHWYGLLQVGEEIFVLPPRKDEHHVMKRDVLLALMAAKVPVFNLTNDVEFDFDDEEVEPVKARIRTRSSQATHEDYFRKEVPVLRPGSRLWLEMAIVADHTMVKFHGDKVQHYILALMNIVSAIFNDRSLDASMTLVINKLFLLEKQDPVVKYGDISETLKRVNKWNKRHLLKIPTESSRWDALVWLTRSELGGPSGLARMNSVCTLNSSTVQRDEGFTSAFVIAHELGHLLGLHHDDKESCDSKSVSTIMSPIVRASLEFTWSSCSRNQFHIKSRRWRCLHERSGADGVELGADLKPSKYSYVFSMDHQCRVEFGEGFTVCKVKMDAPLCSVLYCAHHSTPSTCYSKNAPPLEGTPCKRHHWCIEGLCKPVQGSTNVTLAQWDQWRAGSCNAECGYGLRVSRRRCRNKEAGTCPGPSTKVAPCYSGQHCGKTRDVRAELCRRIVDEYIPYMHDDMSKRCQLWCVNHLGGEPSTFGSLPDGTPCSYQRPYDMCYRGICLEGQCNSTDPGCNWCLGGLCKNYTHSGVRHLHKGWTPIVEIPHDSRRFSVRISTPLPLNIGIRSQGAHEIYQLKYHSNRTKHQDPNDYFKYDINVPQSLRIIDIGNQVTDFNEDQLGTEGRLVVAGALVQWRRMDGEVLVSADSQTTASVTILATAEDPAFEGQELNFSFNFSVPYTTTTMRPQENRRRDRGPCSASCGGGIRLVRQRCSRAQPCKPLMYEACNVHRCEFSWAPGEWEECSQTCGDEGIQDRQLFCVPVGASIKTRGDLIRNSVSPALCTSSPPKRQQVCNQFPCPVYWQELPWTQCSTTCGPGEQYRPLVCPASNEALCGPKPRERHQRCRLRHRCPNYRRPPPAYPDNNTIQSCDLILTEFLKGYCKIPYFRKRCSQTCKKIANG